jgi:hypothetical protein
MTKKELIEALKDLPDDCLILMPSYEDDGFDEVECIETEVVWRPEYEDGSDYGADFLQYHGRHRRLKPENTFKALLVKSSRYAKRKQYNDERIAKAIKFEESLRHS